MNTQSSLIKTSHQTLSVNNCISLFSWNIQNITKLYDPSIVSNIINYDIIGLCEVWISDEAVCKSFFPQHACYVNVRTRSVTGRTYGGVCVYVNNNYHKHILNVYSQLQDCIFILFAKDMFSTDRDFLFGFVYAPPEGSTVYKDVEERNGIFRLESYITSITESLDEDVYLVCAGDFNARLGNRQDFIVNDDCDYLPYLSDSEYPVDTFNIARKSKDSGENNFGTALLSLCCNLNMHVLNGRCGKDKHGELTFLSHQGKSVVDYVVVSSELFRSVCDFEVMSIDSSDHFPLSCKFPAPAQAVADNDELETVCHTRYKWNNTLKDTFTACLNDETTGTLIAEFFSVLPTNVNAAVNCLSNILYHAGACFRCKQKGDNSNCTVPKWWDHECEVAKRKKYVHLNKFRKSNAANDLDMYKQVKNAFKSLCRRKKFLHQKSVASQVCKTAGNPSDLWKNVKKSIRRSQTSCTITSDVWVKYFQNVLSNAHFDIDEQFHADVSDYLDNVDLAESPHIAELDDPITCDEIVNTVCKMKNNKAGGPDGLEIEMVKNSMTTLLPCLHALYNNILISGILPEEWCKAVIFPLHKKGDVSQPDNYRGISLLNVTGKIFTKLINNRLVSWAEDNDKLREQQCGYRRKYSTIDNCFSLHAVAQKYISKSKGRMYCIFVDFSKAFDCVQHELLLYVLHKNNVSGQMVNVIKSMYSQLQSCVRTNTGLSSYFNCKIGTRQGCMLSPFLFIMFLNELIEELSNSNCHGIYVSEDEPCMLQFLFADDIANVTDTPVQLQRIINTIHNFCNKYGMKVNLDKTKIIVFRRGGCLKNYEKWYYDGEQIEVVPYYKYLGMIYSSFLSWYKAKCTLAQQAEKAMNMLLCFIRKNQLPFKQSFFCLITW
jgi:hypothetical protein